MKVRFFLFSICLLLTSVPGNATLTAAKRFLSIHAPAGGGSVPTVVGTTSCTSSGGATFNCSVTPHAVGDTILLAIASQIVVTNVTDNKGNTWVNAATNGDISKNAAGSYFTYIFRVQSAVSAAATTVTVASSFTSAIGYFIDIKNIAGTLDKTVTNSDSTATSTNITTGSTAALAQATEMAVAACQHEGGGADPETSGPSGGFTGLAPLQNSSVNIHVGYLATSSTAAVSSGWTITSGADWNCVVGTYK